MKDSSFKRSVTKLSVSDLELLFPSRHWTDWLPTSMSDGVLLSLLADFRSSEGVFSDEEKINDDQVDSVENVRWVLSQTLASLQDEPLKRASPREWEVQHLFPIFQYRLEREAIARLTGLEGKVTTTDRLVQCLTMA